jgi:hypothetical protein
MGVDKRNEQRPSAREPGSCICSPSKYSPSGPLHSRTGLRPEAFGHVTPAGPKAPLAQLLVTAGDLGLDQLDVGDAVDVPCEAAGCQQRRRAGELAARRLRRHGPDPVSHLL